MGSYAKGTSVSVARSKEEIQNVLVKYGCHDIGEASKQNQGWVIEFTRDNRLARMQVVFPDPDDPEFRTTHNGTRRRSHDQVDRLIEQETRRRFRCLLIYLKGKFEYLDSGVSDFETEFFGHIVDPVKKITMSQMLKHHVQERYLGNDVQPLICLPGPAE